jgi:hypothetical protein
MLAACMPHCPAVKEEGEAVRDNTDMLPALEGEEVCMSVYLMAFICLCPRLFRALICKNLDMFAPMKQLSCVCAYLRVFICMCPHMPSCVPKYAYLGTYAKA